MPGTHFIIQNIDNMQDVVNFIKQIAGEIDNFHPLKNFSNYLYPDSYIRRYTDEEPEIRNRTFSRCFDVCAKYKEDFFTYLINVCTTENCI